ncbi:MAG TPA: hypothetical protein VES42_07065 [Pilimelia sp.]|nr:hypothetical protein [Pilimelia sp.]
MVLRSVTAAALVVAAVLGIGAAPARAAVPVIWVNVALSPQWRAPFLVGLEYIDRHTGTDMRLGTCRPAPAKCIIVVEGATGHSAGYTDFRSASRTLIKLNTRYRGHLLSVRRWVAAHEVGHANGLWWHRSSSCNLMYPYTHCRGRVSPLTVLPADRAVLRRN